MRYPYTKKNLFETGETYQSPGFLGMEFLRAYVTARESFLKTRGEQKQISPQLPSTSRFKTYGRKFEVSKRLWDEPIKTYALVALSLLRSYKKTKDFQALSTTLKINDALCSMKGRVKEHEAQLVFLSVKTETEEMRKLIEKLPTLNLIPKNHQPAQFQPPRHAKTLKDVTLLSHPNIRTLAYLQNLTKNNLLPTFVILLGKRQDFAKKLKCTPNKFFDVHISILDLLKACGIPYAFAQTSDVNSPKLIHTLKARQEKYVVYAASGILKTEILNAGKKFIHLHPGIAPLYRGSTCWFYALLKDDKPGVTAFFMDTGIDTGRIIQQKTFPKPKRLHPAFIDFGYDDYIRSELLLNIMNMYSQTGKFPTPKKQPKKGNTYYLIHPVLRHIAAIKAT